jgi:glycosyltransferase involved in cell wall biosynthesis
VIRVENRRVLRLITRLNVGGPARQALLLTRHLSGEFPTTLAAGRPTSSEGELRDAAVHVSYVPLVRPLRPDMDMRAIVAVRQLLLNTRPALLHSHMAKAGTVGRTASRLVTPRPRTIHTFHGHVLEGYFAAPLRRAFIEVERALARHTDVLIAVSPQIRDALLDLGIGSPRQYRVIPLGLDLSSCLAVRGPSGKLRAELGLEGEVPLIGIVGRLVPIKDHETLLLAMQSLPGVHLAILGDGELRLRLEGRAAALGLADRVHFLGWWIDVASAVADLDVVVLTSRNEGTPVSLIEASAAGRPVVATDVGGVPAVVRHGRTGLLVAPGDCTEIAVAIRRLLADRGFRDQMGRAARADVSERFGEARLVADIRALYQDLTARPVPA